jgi:hypothetical protein
MWHARSNLAQSGRDCADTSAPSQLLICHINVFILSCEHAKGPCHESVVSYAQRSSGATTTLLVEADRDDCRGEARARVCRVQFGSQSGLLFPVWQPVRSQWADNISWWCSDIAYIGRNCLPVSLWSETSERFVSHVGQTN